MVTRDAATDTPFYDLFRHRMVNRSVLCLPGLGIIGFFEIKLSIKAMNSLPRISYDILYKADIAILSAAPIRMRQRIAQYRRTTPRRPTLYLKESEFRYNHKEKISSPSLQDFFAIVGRKT